PVGRGRRPGVPAVPRRHVEFGAGGRHGPVVGAPPDDDRRGGRRRRRPAAGPGAGAVAAAARRRRVHGRLLRGAFAGVVGRRPHRRGEPRRGQLDVPVQLLRRLVDRGLVLRPRLRLGGLGRLRRLAHRPVRRGGRRGGGRGPEVTG